MNLSKKNFILSTIRRASCKWKTRTEAIVAARVSRGMYTCAACKKVFRRVDIRIDHIEPVIPVAGWDNWDNFFDRMFPDSASAFQVLCTEDHRIKTNKENEERRMYKKKG